MTRNKPVPYHRQMQAYATENPEWFNMAQDCIRGWGKNEKQLQHCIAIALKEAYELGLRGAPPPAPEQPATRQRVVRAAPSLQSIASEDVPPAPRQRIIRRGRV